MRVRLLASDCEKYLIGMVQATTQHFESAVGGEIRDLTKFICQPVFRTVNTDKYLHIPPADAGNPRVFPLSRQDASRPGPRRFRCILRTDIK